MEKNQSFLKGAAILSISTIIVKLVGLLFSIPLANTIGTESMGYFTTAYEIFAVFNAAATAGLPVAMSKMVSSAYALDQPERADKIYRVAVTFFAGIGLLSSVLMFSFARQLSGSLPDARYAIQALSPTVFFCCIMSAARGYFQGRSRMTPTAVSQTIEAVTKLCIGIPLAAYIHSTFSNGAYSAAAAITGVSLSAALGMFYLLWVKARQSHVDKKERGSGERCTESGRALLKELLKFSIPITVGSCFLQVLFLVDFYVITSRLNQIQDVLGRTPATLYGIWGNTMKIFDLPGAIIIALSTSILPVLAAAFANNDQHAVRKNTSAALRITFLIAIPCAVGLMIYAKQLSALFYPNSPDSAQGVGILLRYASIGVIFNGVLYTTNAVMQSLGHTTQPVINMVIGGVIRIGMNFFLVGIPDINIMGAVYSLVVSYFLIMVLNLISVFRLVPHIEGLFSTVLSIIVSAVGMAGASWLVFFGLSKVVSEKIAVAIALLVAVAVYFVLAVLVRAIRPSDLKLMPKGERLVKKLHLYEGEHFE